MFHKSVELDLWEITAFCLALHGSRQLITKAVTSLPVHWLMATAGLWAQLSWGHRVSLNFRSIASLIKTKLTRNKYFPAMSLVHECQLPTRCIGLHWFLMLSKCWVYSGRRSSSNLGSPLRPLPLDGHFVIFIFSCVYLMFSPISYHHESQQLTDHRSVNVLLINLIAGNFIPVKFSGRTAVRQMRPERGVF